MNAGKASQMEVERDGKYVRITMRCDSAYDAIMLYDRMIFELHNGGVKLEIESKPLIEEKSG